MIQNAGYARQRHIWFGPVYLVRLESPRVEDAAAASYALQVVTVRVQADDQRAY
jgi:hypothetical protein